MSLIGAPHAPRRQAAAVPGRPGRAAGVALIRRDLCGRRHPSPPPPTFETQAVSIIRICAGDDQHACVHLLMTRAAQQNAVRRRPAAPKTATLQMMHLQVATAAAGATARRVPAPDSRTYSPRHHCDCGPAFASNDDGRLRLRDRRHHRPVLAIVRSVQTRTPGMATLPLTARTTAPSFW